MASHQDQKPLLHLCVNISPSVSAVSYLRPLRQVALVGDPALLVGADSVVDIRTPG